MNWLSDIHLLEKEFFRFDFFQLNFFVQHIQKKARSEKIQLNVRYQGLWRQNFPASDVVQFSFDEDHYTIFIKVAFFTLGGSNGPMPQPYIEYVLDQERLGNQSIIYFFDIFHHKLLKILLEIQQRFSVSLPNFDRKDDERQDTFLDYLSYLTGIGDCVDSQQLHWVNHFPIFHFPIIHGSEKSLRYFIQNIFKEDPIIDELIGYWRKIPQLIQNKLGRQNNTLGENLYLGQKAWINNSSIKITIDARFQNFLRKQCKDIKFIKKFLELVRVYSDDLDLNITLIIWITDFETSDIILGKHQAFFNKDKIYDIVLPKTAKLEDFSNQNNILGVNTYFKDKNSLFMLRYTSRLLIE